MPNTGIVHAESPGTLKSYMEKVIADRSASIEMQQIHGTNERIRLQNPEDSIKFYTAVSAGQLLPVIIFYVRVQVGLGIIDCFAGYVKVFKFHQAYAVKVIGEKLIAQGLHLFVF